MGEVYRARDTRLNRDVALKVLPEAFARDAERLARFRREAQVLASLNHPNIAAIYGFEDSGATHALVMELVEGPTLAEKIKSSAMPFEEALPIAKQIAEALEYAHERGIIHRDLKPANIKLASNDAVKILDFGLAKALEGDPAAIDISTSPTISRMATQAGIILGTAAYMSPEQAKGKSVDRRTDIWTFGCVLYEMLTGKMAFSGETVTDTLASVIKSEPEWNAIPTSTPQSICSLLQRCLKKDARQRLQSIGDARITIEEILNGASAQYELAQQDSSAGGMKPPLQMPVSRWRSALPWVLFAATAFAFIAFVAVRRFRGSAPAPEAAMHFGAVTDFPGVQAQPSLSPDGRSVAFVSNRDGHYNIYVGLVNGGSLVQITNDPNLKSGPSWSPDGTTIAYARLSDSGIWDIWEVPALGGAPRQLILSAADPTWSPDSRSLVYENMTDHALWIASASGENTHRLAGTENTEWLDTQPRFSRDGRKIAFAARNSDGGPYGELAVVDLDSGKTRLLTHDDALVLSPAWSPSGKFIYFASSRGGTVNIWKIGVDGSGLEQITAGEGDDAELDVSADGKRIVFATLREHLALAQLDLPTEPGKQHVKLLSTDPARNQYGPSYSPDGKHLAYFFGLKGAVQEGIGVANADGSNATPLVQDSRVNVFPVWTQDGQQLVYMSSATVADNWEYRRIPVSGGEPQALVKRSFFVSIPEIGRDGRVLFGEAHGEVDTFDLRTGKGETLGTLPAGGVLWLLRWSPDQHSVAYMIGPDQHSMVYTTGPNVGDKPNAGIWVDDFKDPPRQIFHGWVIWFALGPGNQIYLIQGKADLNGVLWKVGWNGQGLTRMSATIPILYNFNYNPTDMTNQFDVSPDGQHVAFQTEQILEENIGMIENIR